MSGGSWEYVYAKFDDVAWDLQNLASTTPARKALGKQVELIAAALHDIEWVDSGDYGPDGADEAIRKALGEDADRIILREVVGEARELANKLIELVQEINRREN